MKPSTKYGDFLQQAGFLEDPVQQQAIYLLDSLHHDILARYYRKDNLATRLKKAINKTNDKIPGLYFWGGVGRGKTFIMDIFFETLPISRKKRTHFHQFMKQIHEELSRTKDRKDPLWEIARNIARDIEVLCLDEFVVTDIGDAMLIGRLLEALFAHNMILVTTSNRPPEELYKEGLQRARFLPAIDLLLGNCLISQLDAGVDYRSLVLRQTNLFQVPHDDAAVAAIREYLDTHLVSAHVREAININDRDIYFEYCAEATIWFSFKELCKTARSRFDYLEIASMFNTLVLSDIEALTDQSKDVTRRFISLIDVLYDHRVKLICTAAVSIEELYQDKSLAFEFQRTVSRLHEMQSEEYISQSHII